MAVDPYVPVSPEDVPRQSLPVPPARGWRAARPGDIDPVVGAGCHGLLFGSPGPDSGYALTLARRFRDRIKVVAPETVDDAEALAAGLAMRRAALFGRAPVLSDLEVAFQVFCWLGDPPPEFVEWRRFTVAGVLHDYARRLALIDAVPEEVLRRPLRLTDADLVQVAQEVRRVVIDPHRSGP
jgi:hypothetical protein